MGRLHAPGMVTLSTWHLCDSSCVSKPSRYHAPLSGPYVRALMYSTASSFSFSFATGVSPGTAPKYRVLGCLVGRMEATTRSSPLQTSTAYGAVYGAVSWQGDARGCCTCMGNSSMCSYATVGAKGQRHPKPKTKPKPNPNPRRKPNPKGLSLSLILTLTLINPKPKPKP